MRIIVPAIGSRGDVQPYIALCQGLQEAVHDVQLATNPTLCSLVDSYGVPVVPVGKPVDMGAAGARIWAQAGRFWWLGLIRIMQLGFQLVRLLFRFANVIIMAPMNRFRKKVGVAPFMDIGSMLSDRLILIPVSPCIFPPNVDWPAHVKMTGYWAARSPQDCSPPADLLEFLEAGDAPVAVSRGAMSLNTFTMPVACRTPGYSLACGPQSIIDKSFLDPVFPAKG